ncbi:riboflavin synthase [Elusimicrobiota bacterium]
MFQGIVTQRGKVVNIKSGTVFVKPEKPWKAKNGESVALNGVCMTVTRQNGPVLSFDIGEETRQITNLGGLMPGNMINIERPLSFGTPISGHIVLGHADGMARVISRKKIGNSLIMYMEIPKKFKPYVVKKGSMAIEGISLTINRVLKETRTGFSFDVCLIPETVKITNLGYKKPGDLLNIEVDYLAKIILQNNNGKIRKTSKTKRRK